MKTCPNCQYQSLMKNGFQLFNYETSLCENCRRTLKVSPTLRIIAYIFTIGPIFSINGFAASITEVLSIPFMIAMGLAILILLGWAYLVNYFLNR